MQNVKDILKMAAAVTIAILVANQITPLVTKAKAA
jgi:hypothetical protein